MLENVDTTLGNVLASIVPAMIFPVIALFILMLFYVYYITILRPERGTTEWVEMRKSADSRRLTFLGSRYPLEKSDVLPATIITAVFIVLAVFNLGKTAPIDVLAEIEIRNATESLSPGSNHLNNMYFDEIYFVRTAVEHINSINPYEWTHPPLGKNIIALSILLFGQSPFGWRLIGAVCGALMLLVMYFFIKNMSGKTSIAACGALLLGFDFMRLVQSRIGTIDTYAVLFIALAYFFMYRYITTDPDAPFRKSLPALALSGLFFGLSFSIKWIGFYAGAGLLVIYVIRLVQLGVHYSNKNISVIVVEGPAVPPHETSEAFESQAGDNDKVSFLPYLFKTLLFSLLFFVIIPAVIYYINYIPYGLARGMTIEGGMLWNPDFLTLVRSNQESMLAYHANLNATHDGSSFWWQWLFDLKPILYVNNYVDGARSTFGGFGNPVLYWGGLAAMVALVVRIFTHRDAKALFIVIGYLAQLLPWVAVTRILFAYHYLPSTLFLVLALAYVFNIIFERKKSGYKGWVYGLTVLTGAVFVMFYPMLSGLFLPHWYYNVFIKWLPNWPF